MRQEQYRLGDNTGLEHNQCIKESSDPTVCIDKRVYHLKLIVCHRRFDKRIVI